MSISILTFYQTPSTSNLVKTFKNSSLLSLNYTESYVTIQHKECTVRLMLPGGYKFHRYAFILKKTGTIKYGFGMRNHALKGMILMTLYSTF